MRSDSAISVEKNFKSLNECTIETPNRNVTYSEVHQELAYSPNFSNGQLESFGMAMCLRTEQNRCHTQESDHLNDLIKADYLFEEII